MSLIWLMIVPGVAGAVAYVTPRLSWRMALLIAAAVAHLSMVAGLWLVAPSAALGGWLGIDPLGLVVLTLVSILFAAAASYSVGYLRRESPRGGRAFTSCLLGFLAAASLVSVSQHLALLWVGMEATTLAVAPLVYHRHDRRSLEAVWKYLVLSSVGIALALLGIFLLATAQPPGAGRPLVLDDMLANAHLLDPVWLKAASVFLLIGFGTKMGLAPLHTWKPDTYGEAPSLVGALMAGALTSCAFLGVARTVELASAAGIATFLRPLLLGFGLLSLIVAAAFMIGQSDVKRLLAYSSVEHMGLLVLGLGLGGDGTYGAMLHLVNNALAKGLLFLAVGNVVLASGSAVAAENRGIVRTLPASGLLLLIGLFAVTGSPPFGLFVSELTILSAALQEGYAWIAAVVAILLAIIFVGIAGMLLEMCYGDPEPDNAREHSPDEAFHSSAPAPPRKESGWLIAGPAALGAAVLMLGLYIPPRLHAVLERGAVLLGGTAP